MHRKIHDFDDYFDNRGRSNSIGRKDESKLDDTTFPLHELQSRDDSDIRSGARAGMLPPIQREGTFQLRSKRTMGVKGAKPTPEKRPPRGKHLHMDQVMEEEEEPGEKKQKKNRKVRKIAIGAAISGARKDAQEWHKHSDSAVGGRSTSRIIGNKFKNFFRKGTAIGAVSRFGGGSSGGKDRLYEGLFKENAMLALQAKKERIEQIESDTLEYGDLFILCAESNSKKLTTKYSISEKLIAQHFDEGMPLSLLTLLEEYDNNCIFRMIPASQYSALEQL